ncbi:MAG: hypothetical protein Q7S95_00370 [bacterium]|nr:hypothetical protein [bacterium]
MAYYEMRKVEHMRRFGIQAELSDGTKFAAARPKWREDFVKEERNRQARAVMAGRAAPGFLDFSSGERELMLDVAQRRRDHETADYEWTGRSAVHASNPRSSTATPQKKREVKVEKRRSRRNAKAASREQVATA